MVHDGYTAGNHPARLLGRALRLRCPRCGKGRLFDRWLAMKECCPSCALRTDRGERDYFLGAMMFNLVAAEGLFAAFMVIAIFATWPAPPWKVLLVAGAALMLGAPFLLYPISKSLWLSFDLFFRADDLTLASTGERRIEPPDPTA